MTGFHSATSGFQGLAIAHDDSLTHCNGLPELFTLTEMMVIISNITSNICVVPYVESQNVKLTACD